MIRRSVIRRSVIRKSGRRKFIPSGDAAFAAMARQFAAGIAEHPEKYMLAAGDVKQMIDAVQRFRDALAEAMHKVTKSQLTVMRKDAARREAERIVRRFGRVIRANDAISTADKVAIGMHVRKGRLRRRACPQVPPRLRFIVEAGSMHVLRFLREMGTKTRAKPFGAVRLELFVALVEPGEKVPATARPDERAAECGHFRGSYLRSFTRNPIEVEVPNSVDGQPMVVVYWGRWAGATGDVGPWSAAVKAGYAR